jgi:hypothetical protein
MEPFEEHELSDRELDALLPEWRAPTAPARLRAAVFPEAGRPGWKRGWKNLWSASIRIPVPVALCMLVLMAAALWQWSARVAAPVVLQDRRVEDRRAEVRPVAELQPRIIRRGHVPN